MSSLPDPDHITDPPPDRPRRSPRPAPVPHPDDGLLIPDPYQAIRYLHGLATGYRHNMHASLAVAARLQREIIDERRRRWRLLAQFRTLRARLEAHELAAAAKHASAPPAAPVVKISDARRRSAANNNRPRESRARVAAFGKRAAR